MRVADLSHMQAVVDVNENDVVNVKLGDKANIKIDAYGDRKFKGVVQQIANTGKTTGTGTQEEVTNFEVKIRVDDHDVALRPGLSCTADIETNMVKDAVAVPMQSVTIRTGDTTSARRKSKNKSKKSPRATRTTTRRSSAMTVSRNRPRKKNAKSWSRLSS
jgi:Membrane-fusion protein